MKLVLIQPPIRDFYESSSRLQPIGLGYLKAAVKKHLSGVEVRILDFHQGWGRRTAPLPNELSYLRDYYPWPDQSPFALFHQYYHFGASFERVAREVAREEPDLVGISSLFSPYYREALQCADLIKKEVGCPIVLGGSHVSAVPELMLKKPSVDWVIRGEGERPLVELLKAWKEGRTLEEVPNLGFKKEGRLIFNPVGEPYAIDEIPFPDLSDLDRRKYLFEKNPLCFVMTSRGCPHHCSFCSIHRTFPGYRRRSTDSVLEEIIHRVEEGFRIFDFEDDNLTFDQNEMKTLCRKLDHLFPKGTLRFLAMNGISYQSLDLELLTLMRKAGFTHLNIALVSADSSIRRGCNRSGDLGKYLRVVQEAASLGFKMVSYQILGLPGESLKAMIKTLVLQTRLPVLLGASPFYLSPETPIAKQFPEMTDEDHLKSRLTAMAVETDQFEREDIYTLFVTIRIINFLKGLPVPKARIRLEEALRNAYDQGKRAAQGSELLTLLLSQGVLYAATPKGLKRLPRFKAKLFHELWGKLGVIRTLEGKIILIKGQE